MNQSEYQQELFLKITAAMAKRRYNLNNGLPEFHGLSSEEIKLITPSDSKENKKWWQFWK